MTWCVSLANHLRLDITELQLLNVSSVGVIVQWCKVFPQRQRIIPCHEYHPILSTFISMLLGFLSISFLLLHYFLPLFSLPPSSTPLTFLFIHLSCSFKFLQHLLPFFILTPPLSSLPSHFLFFYIFLSFPLFPFPLSCNTSILSLLSSIQSSLSFPPPPSVSWPTSPSQPLWKKAITPKRRSTLLSQSGLSCSSPLIAVIWHHFLFLHNNLHVNSNGCFSAPCIP